MITIQDPTSGGASTLQALLDTILSTDNESEPFYLVVFDQIDHFDEVKLRRQELRFSRNSHGKSTARTSIFLHPYVAGELHLPIVAGGTDSEPRSWQLVGNAQVAISADAENSAAMTVIVERDLDDAVRIVEPNATSASSGWAWADLWRTIPRTIDRNRSNDLDLVIAIELSGPPAIVTPRLEHARKIITEVVQQASTRHRCGLLGYRDHQFRFDGNKETIIDSMEPGAMNDAIERLLLWQERVDSNAYGLRQDRYAAPVEDMLQAAKKLPWRDRTNRVLLTIGSRPPHPARKELDRAMQCPNGVDWEVEFSALQRNPLQSFFAIRDAPPWPVAHMETLVEPSLQNRYDAVWQSLGIDNTPQSNLHDDDSRVSLIVAALLRVLQAPGAIPLAKATA